jgi:hypothetical protein
MPRNPEAVFRTAVERYLPEGVYRQSLGGPYANGTPDRYYEGPAGVLWAEYKYARQLPGVVDLVNGRSGPKLSALQALWLKRANANKVLACVILGWGPKEGVLLLQFEWNSPMTQDLLQRRATTRKDLASTIAELTLGHSNGETE